MHGSLLTILSIWISSAEMSNELQIPFLKIRKIKEVKKTEKIISKNFILVWFGFSGSVNVDWECDARSAHETEILDFVMHCKAFRRLLWILREAIN